MVAFFVVNPLWSFIVHHSNIGSEPVVQLICYFIFPMEPYPQPEFSCLVSMLLVFLTTFFFSKFLFILELFFVCFSFLTIYFTSKLSGRLLLSKAFKSCTMMYFFFCTMLYFCSNLETQSLIILDSLEFFLFPNIFSCLSLLFCIQLTKIWKALRLAK